MKEKISNLIDLKSIITIIMVITLVFGFADKRIESEDFVVFVNMILIYYFTRKESKEG